MGMRTPGSSEARKVRLSQVKYYKKSYKGSYVTISHGNYVGTVSAMGSELIGDISESHAGSRKPSALDLYQSQTHSGDLVAVPVGQAGPDSLSLVWSEKGRRAKLNAGTMLATYHINIPAESRIVIALTPNTDADLGDVIHIQLVGAQFKPVVEGKKRKAGASGAAGARGAGTANPAQTNTLSSTQTGAQGTNPVTLPTGIPGTTPAGTPTAVQTQSQGSTTGATPTSAPTSDTQAQGSAQDTFRADTERVSAGSQNPGAAAHTAPKGGSRPV